MKIKVMVFGDKMMIRRLTLSLVEEGMEVLTSSGGPKAMALLKQKGIDLAVVDSLMEEAEAVCRRIREIPGIPVVLMVSRNQADWKKFLTLDSDGYIFDGAGHLELAARLRAVLRRYLLNK